MSTAAPTAASRAAADKLRLVVVTPETTLVDLESTFVVLPLFDGEIGLAPRRAPLIGRLGYGEMRVTLPGGNIERYYVDGGFVQVLDNSVSVLTNRAVVADELSPQQAEQALADARGRKVSTPELLSIRERLELQARAQLRLARRGRR